MIEGWEPFGITTEAGKRLWLKMNRMHGSSTWGPVGDGIAEVEKEVTQRIIDLLEENLYNDDECKCDGCKVARYVVELIKREN